MSATGLRVFDSTVQETNLWLKRCAEQLHRDDRQIAYQALRATLHALRDRLTPADAVHLGAQLPLLLRGIFYEGWRMATTPTSERHVDAFVAHVRQEMADVIDIDAAQATRASLAVLAEKLDPGEIAKLQRILPSELTRLFPTFAQHH